MNANDIESYFAVENRIKELVGKQAHGWNDEYLNIISFEKISDNIIIRYSVLIDDYNGTWYTYSLNMTVSEFCS